MSFYEVDKQQLPGSFKVVDWKSSRELANFQQELFLTQIQMIRGLVRFNSSQPFD